MKCLISAILFIAAFVVIGAFFIAYQQEQFNPDDEPIQFDSQ